VTFLAIGVAGLLGAVAAGRLADRLGRTAITRGAMLISAACCLVSPLAFGPSVPSGAAVRRSGRDYGVSEVGAPTVVQEPNRAGHGVGACWYPGEGGGSDHLTVGVGLA
jgi:MFS family permease